MSNLMLTITFVGGSIFYFLNFIFTKTIEADRNYERFYIRKYGIEEYEKYSQEKIRNTKVLLKKIKFGGYNEII